MKTVILVAILSALVFVDQALAQEPASASTPAVSGQGGLTEYRVGPGDVLSIRVSGVREFDQSLRVSNSGRVRVPFVGIMYTAGMTTTELEREIAQKIRDFELVNEPQVRVQVEQYRAWPVHVVGEVTTPGQFVITGEMYVLDLIAKAGGLANSADEIGILYRRGASRPSVTARLTAGPPPDDVPPPPVSEAPPTGPPSDAQVIPINLDDLREGKRPELNIRLQGGDVLYVPRRKGRNIFIIGDVRVPGAYALPRHGTISAAQAVIYAGGTLVTAKNSAAFLMRHDENGVRQAIPIDFIEIIKGKKPDIPVQEDDIIFVPLSPTKQIAVQLLNQIPRLIQQLVIF